MIATPAWGSSFHRGRNRDGVLQREYCDVRTSGMERPGRVTVALFLSTASSGGPRQSANDAKQQRRHNQAEQRLETVIARCCEPRQTIRKNARGTTAVAIGSFWAAAIAPLPDQVGEQCESPDRRIGEDANGYCIGFPDQRFHSTSS